MSSHPEKGWISLFLLCCCFIYAAGKGTDSTQDSIACYDCCRPDGHAPVGVMTDHLHEKGKWTVSYSFMNMQMNGNRIGTKAVSDEVVFKHYMMSPGTMRMQMHMLMGMVGISNKLTVMGMINYNQNRMTMTMSPTNMHTHMAGMEMNSSGMATSSNTSGIGDSKIYLLYKLMDACRQRIIIGAGINIPTGSTIESGAGMLGMNTRFPYSMQLGSGTWDLIPSITYIGQRRILSWGAETGANIKPTNNAAGYSVGNQYNATAWISCKFTEWSSFSVRGEGIRTEKINGLDPSVSLVNTVYTFPFADPTADAFNYGGQQASLFFGLNFFKPKQPIRGLRLLLEFGIPVYQDLNGLQMSQQNTLQVATQYTF